MMVKNLFLSIFLVVFGTSLYGQSAASFQKQFQEARTYMKDGDYGNAMSTFNELTYSHKRNDFVEISHYYYALCAYKNGQPDDAQIMLSKLTSNYQNWRGIEEAYYLEALIYYEKGNFESGDSRLSNIKGNKLKDEIEGLKKHYLQKIQSVDSLLTLLDKNPKDEFLQKLTLSRILSGPIDGKKRHQLEYLIQDYKLNREDYASLLEKQSVFKDKYKVAVLLPFNVRKGQEPDRRDKIYYELYSGIKLAADSLNESGKEIEVFAYDTKKDTNKVQEILTYPEFKSFDLIIGPVWSQTSELVSTFAEANQINFVNPVSSRGNFFSGKQHTFFYKPSGKTIAHKCADYALSSFDSTKNTVLIFYGDKTKDSVMAATYKARMDSAGKNVGVYHLINRENANDFENQILRQNPQDISHLIICSEDRFVGAHLMHPLEDQDIVAPTIVSSKWLDIHTIDYSQFRRRNFHFIYSDYIADSIPAVKSMQERYHKWMQMPALNDYPYIGYEIMFEFGSRLFQYGTLFNQETRNEKMSRGVLTNGVQYGVESDNQVVPILIFNEEYDFEWVNKPNDKNQ